MKDKQDLFKECDVTEQESLKLKSFAFLKTQTHHPDNPVEIGSIVYDDDFGYGMVALMSSDQALIKHLEYKKDWGFTKSSTVKYLKDLEEVELPKKFEKLGAGVMYRSLGKVTHTPKKVNSNRPTTYKKWW